MHLVLDAQGLNHNKLNTFFQTTILTKITIGYELEEQTTVRKVVIGKIMRFPHRTAF